MYTYSIMPIKPSQEKYFDEICADIREQYESGVSSCPLFKMNLVPEGNPVTDKVGPLCKLYRRYREALAPYGVKTGVLVQASLGHGYRLDLAPFTQYVNLCDGQAQHVYCPEDENFLAHFCDVIGQIAAEHPELKVGKINVDQQRELAKQHKVFSIPTLVVYHKGELTARSSGVRPKDEILNLI